MVKQDIKKTIISILKITISSICIIYLLNAVEFDKLKLISQSFNYFVALFIVLIFSTQSSAQAIVFKYIFSKFSIEMSFKKLFSIISLTMLMNTLIPAFFGNYAARPIAFNRFNKAGMKNNFFINILERYYINIFFILTFVSLSFLLNLDFLFTRKSDNFFFLNKNFLISCALLAIFLSFVFLKIFFKIQIKTSFTSIGLCSLFYMPVFFYIIYSSFFFF